MCYSEMIMCNLQEQTEYATQKLVKSKTIRYCSLPPIIPPLQIDVNLIGKSATANHTTIYQQYQK